MKKNYKLILSILFLFYSQQLLAQDDLLSSLKEEVKTETKVSSTFKGIKIINGESVETRRKNSLVFLISHRFGNVSDGASELFGLDNSNIRFGLDYSLSNDFTVGLGRSSYQKVYDGFLKYKILKQGSNFPLTVTAYSNLSIQTMGAPEGKTIAFSDRVSYAYQILIARKFSKRFSMQISPSLIHHNLSLTSDTENDTYAVGFGARYKLSKRISLNAEYFLRLNNKIENNYDAFALGVDIDTGGHVFQLHITNAQSMLATGFVPQTTSNFFKGDIHLGFNISRTFSVKK